MGSSAHNVLFGRLRWGRGQWFMGTHPCYAVASSIFRMFERPICVGGILILAGYAYGGLRGDARYEDGSFRSDLRRWQLGRLARLVTGGVR